MAYNIFQSYLSSIKTLAGIGYFLLKKYFNPTLVRLKPHSTIDDNFYVVKFQSYLSSIKTIL